ncbi:MAG: hypothetical protein MK101_10050 [Phycisphaerales bacterium]|nr:hypothetical protein [Phycisphaerales bacterium]
MSATVHVIHARTLRDRPGLVAQLEAWRSQLPGTLVVLSGATTEPGAVSMAPGALARWCKASPPGLTIGWGEEALLAVSALRAPTAAVLDGLIAHGQRGQILDRLSARRLPVLVSSSALKSRIDTLTDGRARVTWLPPMMSAGGGRPVEGTMRVIGEPASATFVRPVLDVPIRIGLAVGPWRCSASRAHPDWSACDQMLRSCDLPGLDSADEPCCQWAAGAAAAPSCRGEEPVWSLLEAWARGGRLLLPRGHAAIAVSEVLGDAVVDCDHEPAVATEQAAQPDALRGDRERQCQLWSEAAAEIMTSLLQVAQHS